MKGSTPILLDTSVLLHLVRGSELGQRIDRKFELRARPEKPLLSVVTVGEMFALATRLQWAAKKRDALEALLRELVIVDIHADSVLRAYATIKSFLVTHGKAVGDNDVWIASTAHVAGALLLTTDKDFAPLDPQFLRHHCVPLEPRSDGGAYVCPWRGPLGC